MEIYALFDDESCEKIDFVLLKPGHKTNVIELTFLNSVPDNIRESFDVGIKESFFLLSELCNELPEKVSIWFKGFSKNVRGNSTDIAFALSLPVYYIKKGILEVSNGIGIISATGTIQKDGQIGKIVGIKSKISAAASIENSNSKRNILFYPKANFEELEELIKEDPDFESIIKESKIELVPLTNIKEAFDYLNIKNRQPDPETKSSNSSLKFIITACLCLFVLFVAIAVTLFVNKGLFGNNDSNIKYVSNSSTPETRTPTKKSVDVSSRLNTPSPKVTAPATNTIATPTVMTSYTVTPIPEIFDRSTPSANQSALQKVLHKLSLEKDNSILVTFNYPVDNTNGVSGALNGKNYILYDIKPRSSGLIGSVPDITVLEPNIKYRLVYQDFINADSFSFKIKIGNIQSIFDNSFIEEKVWSLKTNDLKPPSLISGPSALRTSEGWKVSLSFSETLDRSSAEDASNYMFLDHSKSEDSVLANVLGAKLKLMKDKKTVQITLPDLEPEIDSLKLFFITDDSIARNMLDEEDINTPMIIKSK